MDTIRPYCPEQGRCPQSESHTAPINGRARSRSPSLSPRAGSMSSPSTPSEVEFEFDSIAASELLDEPPISPRFMIPHTSGRWNAFAYSEVEEAISKAASSCRSAETLRGSQENESAIFHSRILETATSPRSPASVRASERHEGAILNGYSEATQVSRFCKQQQQRQTFSPSSTSVRQLINHEMVGDKMTDLAPFEAQQASPGLHGYLQVEEDKHQESMAIRRRERKSSSTLFDKSNVAISADPIDNVKLIPSKSESHARFVASASAPLSPRSLSALIRRSDKSEEGNGSAGTKKAPTKSSKKWAFRDLLRRTVPNSKADAHYINRTLGDPSSPSAFLSSGRSTSSNMTSHLASPPRTAANHSMDSMASFMDRRGYVRAPRSPRHRSSLTLSPPHPLRSSDTHSDVRKPHIASGTPTPSPPRSPMSPHESYYMHQKAHAQELGKKAFLPYRQSLLGCLRGSDVLSPNQLVW